MLVVFLKQRCKEFFNADLMDHEDFHQRFQSEIHFAFFQSPILHARKIMIQSKCFMTFITFLDTELD